MKTNLLATLGAFIAAGSFLPHAVAQNKDTPPPARPVKPDDTPDRASDSVIIPLPAPADETDFIIRGAKGGKGEVKIAELGVAKAQDEKVKTCAQMLVKEHAAANEELKALADNLNIRLDETADSTVEKIWEELSLKSGREFDKAFLQEMATSHEKGISLYEAGKKLAKNKQVAAFIEKMLPALKSHAAKIAEVGGWEPLPPGPRPKPVVDPAPDLETNPGANRPGSEPPSDTNKQ